jgi:protein phosphatase
MKIDLPEPSLVLLIGTTGSGKSTFARAHFRPTEILSSDFFRGVVSDDENDQTATTAAFDVLHLAAARRMEAGRLTVVDATNVQLESRKSLLEISKRYGVPAVAIVLDIPKTVCAERNSRRPDRRELGHVLTRQHAALRRSIPGLAGEGFE